MKLLYKTLFVLFISYCLTSCNSTPVLTETHLANGQSHTGVIDSFSYERKSTEWEELGSFIVGDYIGEQFGGGSGSVVLGIAGGFTAEHLYEQNYANYYTKLIISADNGLNYPVYIKGKLQITEGEKVKISVKDNRITGISLR